MDITIVGAGLSGLVAANMLMGRAGTSIMVIERQPRLPNNHKALLRFRTDQIGQMFGIPFRKVNVLKMVLSEGCHVADALAYSRKTTGRYELRSITSAFGPEIVERYIAPDNLVELLYERLRNKATFSFGGEVGWHFPQDEGIHTISTIPMPDLVRELGYKHPMPSFDHRFGMSVRFKVRNADAHATVYLPDPSTDIYRVSITGDEVIVELATEEPVKDIVDDSVTEAVGVLGIRTADIYGDVTVHQMRYGKIAAINDAWRKEFIMWASREKKVYSLGRFATWRPGLLMDDIVNDVRVIDRLMSSPTSVYSQLKKV